MTGNGNPRSKPSPSTEQRVAAHLRKARGKSPRFLARRYRRSLVGYLRAPEAGDAADDSLADLDPGTITALKIVGACAAERVRFAREAANGGQAPDARTLARDATADALGALAAIADGDVPEGLRTRYHTEERAPPYLIVVNALVGISERGRMD